MMNECPKCNYHNPPQAVTCRVCNLKLPRTNPPTSLLHTATRPKMAVFDLDKTLFDLSRRERAAKRQGLKEGSNKWYEFLNQNKYILMDTPIPGTVNFVKQLSENGFTIAYLSGRPRHSLAATKQSLQENGFPIDATEQDLVFLHSGKGSIKNITNHKKNVLTHLKNVFDIDFFFDDTPEFREAAKSLFIPGVYPSISSYTGKEERSSSPKKKGRSKRTRKNPGEKNCGCGQDPCITYGKTRSNPHALVCPEHGIRAEEEIGYRNGSLVCAECGSFLKMDGNVKVNPVPKPRKKRTKSGSMRKEPLKKYIERFMGDKKMNEEFPDRSQRFAVAATTARKFYGNSAVNKAYPKDNPLTLSKTKEEIRKDLKARWDKIEPEKPSKKLQTNLLKYLEAKAIQNKAFSRVRKKYTDYELANLSYDELKSGIAAYGFVPTLDSSMSEGEAAWHDKHILRAAWMTPGGDGPSEWLWNITKNPDRKATTYFAKYLDEAGYFLQSERQREAFEDTGKTYRDFGGKLETWEEMVKKRDFLSDTGPLRDMDIRISRSNYSKLLRNLKWMAQEKLIKIKPVKYGGWEKRFIGYETLKPSLYNSLYGTDIIVNIAHSKAKDPRDTRVWKKGQTYEGYWGTEIEANPRSNPHTPVHEAKEFYKQFHQKPAKTVKKTKVDIGDTWVGLGKAWSIGYRSGKETGNEAQKYIHNFGVDEESGKQFKEPDLYYVKNNDGSQMMVIMGGDWYIDVDEEGQMSWIYI